jgi:hypothetical protein
MLTLESSVTPRASVVATQLDNGDAVLLDMATAKYFSLNPAGARVWQLLDAGMTLGDVSEHIFGQYEVAQAQAQQSVLSLVGALVDQGLVEIAA